MAFPLTVGLADGVELVFRQTVTEAQFLINVKLKNKKMKKEISAETKDGQSTKYEVTTSSHAISKPIVMRRYPLGGLNEDEWKEIVGLDYVLTWGYTNQYNNDLSRYKMLSAKRWAGLLSCPEIG